MIEFSNNDAAGMLPMFFREHDPRPAQEQLNERYAHGGGFSPFKGFTLVEQSSGTFGLQYPGDPVMQEVSRALLHDQMLVLFEGSWLAIIEQNMDYVVCRVD